MMMSWSKDLLHIDTPESLTQIFPVVRRFDIASASTIAQNKSDAIKKQKKIEQIKEEIAWGR